MERAADQARRAARGEVSPLELVEAALARIERVQARSNAFTQVLAHEARARARSLEAAPARGPLYGVPVALKDLFDVRHALTSGCCRAYARRRARAHAAVVERLEGAGAIVVAKTNQHELACGATNLVSSYGPTTNPWDPARITGGSSGGSGAAVAAGAVVLALGSDTGGSIRIPAALCGVTGLKPTHGAIPLRGAMPMCPSLDVAGPLARTAADCALAWQVLAGPDPGDLWSRSPGPPPPPPQGIGIARPFLSRVHPEVRAAVEQAAKVFASLSMPVVEADAPDPDESFAIFTTRLAELAHSYRDLWGDERVSPPIRRLIDLGRAVTGPDAFAGRELGLRVRRQFERALDWAGGALLAPVTPFPAPRTTDKTVPVEGDSIDVESGGMVRLTLPVNVAGLPAVAFPVGFSSEGLPIGAQLIGPEWSELELCRLVARYQEATDVHLRAPPEPGPPTPGKA